MHGGFKPGEESDLRGSLIDAYTQVGDALF